MDCALEKQQLKCGRKKKKFSIRVRCENCTFTAKRQFTNSVFFFLVVALSIHHVISVATTGMYEWMHNTKMAFGKRCLKNENVICKGLIQWKTEFICTDHLK